VTFRIAVDTGGTFTDAVIVDHTGRQAIGKALTTPDRIFEGMRDAIKITAEAWGAGLDEVLHDTELLIYGTTRATNAVVTGNVAKTAFLTTKGFRDTLVFREGGKFNPHDYATEYPEPYIPRRWTFEIEERIDSAGNIVRPLNEEAARETIEALKTRGFEAVAVSFLWSVANAEHELAVARLLDEMRPGVPYTLSHQLIPIVREYRRASATAIDASLKPLMQHHLSEMEEDLRAAGFKGETLVSTSGGGCQHVAELVERPIHTLKSGPAMAPVASKTYCAIENLGDDIIVCDAGGTTFDVGLVRDGGLIYTRDTWVGPKWIGHLVAMSTVDVRSVGAGGGSIAWIDPGGLLRVGPQSAGAMPGPACYGRSGDQPTVTDAAVVLGYIDPGYFLGGRMTLDVNAANNVIATFAELVGKPPQQAAADILTVANELMIKAIHEITVSEGLNPRESIIVAGGGAAGLNILPIAEELGCETVILPKTASTLSACGMHFSDIMSEKTISRVTLSGNFDFDGVNAALKQIDGELEQFRRDLPGDGSAKYRKEFFAEARYQAQVWELDTPLPVTKFEDASDVDALIEAFHTVHDRIYAVRDEGSQVECVNWKGRLSVQLSRTDPAAPPNNSTPYQPAAHGERAAYFPSNGNQNVNAEKNVPVYRGVALNPGATITGPAIIEEPTTTIVIYPGMRAAVSDAGNYILTRQ
jgi:N-methylhydantoinase A